jgi:ATP-dependent exoDNAse (exonuclease V) alpha subunit
MVKNLVIRKGAPVVMTVNHSKKEYKEDGLVNGAKGYIDYIQTSRHDRQTVKIIWVVFRNGKIGKNVFKRHTNHLRPCDSEELCRIKPRALPILPIRRECEVSDRKTHLIRAQWALSLAYALTSHKCQGDTLEKIIVDFTPNSRNRTNNDFGMFYVAITCVTNKENLFLRSFHRRHIQHSPRVEYEIETMKKSKR